MGMDAALTMGGRSGLNSHDWVKTLSSSSITYPIRREQMMRRLVLALVVLGAAAISTQAQNAIPDLKGTWSGKGKALVFGTNPHHPGSQTATDAPRVRDIEATYTVEGQEGRLVWGRSASTAADTKEPFAWAIASDNKTIVGADMDGYFRITLVGPNRMEKCYTHNGTSPSRSVVATCYMMDRVKR
jgi:hypothetical protein